MDKIDGIDEVNVRDDMTFEKAQVPKHLLDLQTEVIEFVTSVILKHEREFYDLINKNFPHSHKKILGNTRRSIIEMITLTTNKFYNNLYTDVQNAIISNDFSNCLVKVIRDMCQKINYNAHILLEKLIHLTLEVHIEVSREELVFDNDYDVYEKSVLMQINLRLLSINLIHLLQFDIGDAGDFVFIPEGKKAFNVIIDKNIMI